jgi:hypothetical protein
MDTGRQPLRDPRERLSALALAVAVTILVFAAIDTGFSTARGDAGWRESPAIARQAVPGA